MFGAKEQDPHPGPDFPKRLTTRAASTSTKNPRAFARGLIGHNKIRSGGLLPLPAPAEQTQRTEAARKERECGILSFRGFDQC